MELPIAPQTYEPSADAMVRAIKRMEVILARTAASETQLDTATAFTNPDRPSIHVANFAADVCVTEQLTAEKVVEQILQHFADQGSTCHQVYCNDTEWPAELARQLETRGYHRRQTSVRLLSGYIPPTRLNTQLQIIPGRAAYAQLREFYRQSGIEQHDMNEKMADDLAATQIDHLDEPRKELFLGRLDGRAVGFVSLVTLGQIGVIDDVFTAADVRGQGVASTLLAHTVDHCQRALFEQVILEVREDNSLAMRLYDSLGFKPVASIVAYRLPKSESRPAM